MAQHLIVEGLDPNTVLVSVKKMRENDGINTYFNSGNAAGIGTASRCQTAFMSHSHLTVLSYSLNPQWMCAIII